RELSRRAGSTLFMTLLATYQVLLWRLSGERDISVGTPVAGRTRSEVEPLIGLFVNTLVMRTQIDSRESFTELLNRVRQSCLGAYEHQELPFERLVEELQPQRSLSYQPLFQVMFQLQRAGASLVSMRGLEVSGFGREAGEQAKFDLSLAMVDGGAQLRGAMSYNADLFERETVERMLSSFTELVTSISEDALQRVGELPLLSQEERHHLLYEWNQRRSSEATSEADAGPESYVQDEVERRAKESPDRVALRCREESLSYRELNERANRLAHYLKQQGIGPEVVVGLCLPRSIDMVVSLLAVIKAGGAYLPLDAEHPVSRLHYMLKESGARLLVTESGLTKSSLLECDELEHSEGESVRRILVDRDAWQWATSPSKNPERVVSAENLAYLIYTSGSTGRPKGVAITHRSLANLVSWHRRPYRVSPDAAAPQISSPSFDAVVWEIWP